MENSEENSDEHMDQDVNGRDDTAPVNEKNSPTSWLTLFLAIMALVFSVYAMDSNSGRVDSREPEYLSRITSIDGKLAGVNKRLGDVEAVINRSKGERINNKIKRLLLNVKDVALLADEETKTRIGEIEEMFEEILSAGDKASDSAPIARPIVAPAR